MLDLWRIKNKRYPRNLAKQPLCTFTLLKYLRANVLKLFESICEEENSVTQAFEKSESIENTAFLRAGSDPSLTAGNSLLNFT